MDPKGLRAQADAVRQVILRQRPPLSVLEEAEKTLRKLDTLANEVLERHEQEDLSDEIATELLAVLRLPTQ